MKTIIAFVTGAAIGSVTTWYLVKERYKKIAQEEIDSVKATFTYRKYPDDAPQDSDEASDAERAEKALHKPDIMEYANMMNKNGYTAYSNSEREQDEPFVGQTEDHADFGIKDIPYVIPPEEFGEFSDYSRITLTYYSDHILADENDEIVEDVEDVVGFESLGHFGEYEDDSVHVRNDRLKADYEILLDQRRYADVIETKPYLKEE